MDALIIYAVTAADGSQESALSTTVSTTPEAPDGTAFDGQLHAVAGDQQVTLTWTPATHANSYDIYWWTAAGVSEQTSAEFSDVVSPLIITGLTNGVTYVYAISDKVAGAESALSPEVAATPEPLPESPASLGAVAADGLVTVTWPSVPGATSYNLYWATTPNTMSTLITNVTSPFTHAPISNGPTYVTR